MFVLLLLLPVYHLGDQPHRLQLTVADGVLVELFAPRALHGQLAKVDRLVAAALARGRRGALPVVARDGGVEDGLPSEAARTRPLWPEIRARLLLSQGRVLVGVVVRRGHLFLSEPDRLVALLRRATLLFVIVVIIAAVLLASVLDGLPEGVPPLPRRRPLLPLHRGGLAHLPLGRRSRHRRHVLVVRDV